MKSLLGKNIVITGAASGIGREMSLLFAGERANLAIVDIDKKALEEVEAELGRSNLRVKSYKCDISDKRQVEKVSKIIVNDFDHIDLLVNNAGIVSGKSIADSSYDDIKRTLDVNLLGLIWMTKQFLPAMMERDSGHIVNIASAAGLLAVPRLGDYCAAKFAVVGFTDSLRMEMRKYGYKGIKVTCICPSIIDTGMFEGFKAPFLSPILQPAEVAGRIIKTIKKERSYLKLPFMVKIIPLFKFFPARFGDWVAEITGVTRGMDDFMEK